MPNVKRPAALTTAIGLAALLAMSIGAQIAVGASADLIPSQGWSTPMTLTSCGIPSAPYVLFPSDNAQHSSGPGAIVWGAAGSGCDGHGGVLLAQIGSGNVPGVARPDAPGMARPLHEPDGEPVPLGGVSAAASVPDGEIVIAGERTSAQPSTNRGSFTEGRAGGAFTAPIATGGPTAPTAAATAYLGDAGFASIDSAGPGRPEELSLQIQRHYAHSFGPPVTLSGASPAPSQLALALDFRSDALVAWRQGSAIFARSMSNQRKLGPVERLAAVAGSSQLVDLNSDDNRGMVAWTSQRGGQTSVYLDFSAVGYRFGTPQLLERFDDPEGMAPPPGSLRLVRLAEESVMIAWTGVDAGRYVVRVAAVNLQGAQAPVTVSDQSEDALLSGLAAGPDNEILALWSVPARGNGRFELDRAGLEAASGIDVDGTPVFAAPERVSPPGAIAGASVAFDPDTDAALAAWREGSKIRYAVRPGSQAAPSEANLQGGTSGDG